MIRYYKTIEGKLEKLNSYEDGCWVNLVETNNEEIGELSNVLDLDVDSINAALDAEERSRIDVEDNHTLILIDIPIDEKYIYDEKTLPNIFIDYYNPKILLLKQVLLI